ncbi:MAG: CCA tRNA nucleotidyltransferase [Bryobacteraceae bacterium]
MERLAVEIVARLKAAGFQAYLVGGCVRDLLLRIQPRDYDVATDATPDQVLALFPKAHRIGAHFGVVLVQQFGAGVEVATFRSDHDYTDGRRPEAVRFEKDPKQDALRRDFTINALFMDPESSEILDYVGGRKDLAAATLRAIGEPEVRFAEDHLRMLRAVRFAARFRFKIEDATMGAIQRLAEKIELVSAERIRGELVRILTEGGARQGMEMLDESGLLSLLLP